MVAALRLHLRILLLAVFFSSLPFTGRGESWFDEVKQIKMNADTPRPRSHSFEILPDFNFTPDAVAAGARFKNKGERVIVRHVQIEVHLPVRKVQGQFVFKDRVRAQDYAGEPSWFGRWSEPWQIGFFTYTVTATYQGNIYVANFRVGRNTPTSPGFVPPSEPVSTPAETKPAGAGPG